jgi:putative phosphoesterase
MSAGTERIGLIADTHGLCRPGLAAVFRGVSLIVHAGDVGGGDVLASLSRLAPVAAVAGNVDHPHDPLLPSHRSLPVGGLVLRVSHGHELGSPTPEAVFRRYDGDILVFGHTHRAAVARFDRPPRGVLVVNPGAAGPRRFDLRPSVARLTIVDGQVDVEIVEIG